jgi:heat shock protein HslJ
VMHLLYLKAFEKTLQNIERYDSTGDRLAAFDSSGREIMLLERIRSTGLEHRFWHIQEYKTEQGTRKNGHPKTYMITFAQGRLQGIATCTGYAGKYTVTGDSLSVRARERSLFGYCSPYDRDEDQRLVDALNKASRIKEDGAHMLLQDAQGNTNIVLAPYAQQKPY